jgi:RNA-binding protein 26
MYQANLDTCGQQVIQAANKALIQFSTHQEALLGLRSTDAVLGNRFIKILWANRDDELDAKDMNRFSATTAPTALPSSSSSSSSAPGTSAASTTSAATASSTLASSNTADGTAHPKRHYPGKPNNPAENAAAIAATAAAQAAIAANKAARAQQDAELSSIQQKKDNFRKSLLAQQEHILTMMSKATSAAIKSELKAQFDKITKMLEDALQKDKNTLSQMSANKKLATTSSTTSTTPTPPSDSTATAANASPSPQASRSKSKEECEKSLLDKELEILAETSENPDGKSDKLKELQLQYESLQKEV